MSLRTGDSRRCSLNLGVCGSIYTSLRTGESRLCSLNIAVCARRFTSLWTGVWAGKVNGQGGGRAKRKTGWAVKFAFRCTARRRRRRGVWFVVLSVVLSWQAHPADHCGEGASDGTDALSYVVIVWVLSDGAVKGSVAVLLHSGSSVTCSLYGL